MILSESVINMFDGGKSKCVSVPKILTDYFAYVLRHLCKTTTNSSGMFCHLKSVVLWRCIYLSTFACQNHFRSDILQRTNNNNRHLLCIQYYACLIISLSVSHGQMHAHTCVHRSIRFQFLHSRFRLYS